MRSGPGRRREAEQRREERGDGRWVIDREEWRAVGFEKQSLLGKAAATP